ncbi:MAG TPA: putative Ig domain-containing protein, partial [Blastocatellia bacterium]
MKTNYSNQARILGTVFIYSWLIFSDSLIVSIPFKARAEDYTYDHLGRLTKVTNCDGSTINYSYDNAGNRSVMTVTAATKTITVTSPNSVVSWTLGSTQTVTWSSSSVTGNVDILLSRDGGLTWETLAANTANDGSQSVLVSGTPTTQARIRVRATSCSQLKDDGDVNFTIAANGADSTPPDTTITVTLCGQILTTNSATITWTGSDNVTPAGSLQYQWKLDNGDWTAAAAATSMTLPGLANGMHSFEVRAIDQAGNTDASPAGCAFTVDTGGSQVPTITLMTPSSGAPGTTVTILGANLLNAAALSFGGVSAAFTATSATSMVATVPPGALTGPVTVTTPNGAATSAVTFTVLGTGGGGAACAATSFSQPALYSLDPGAGALVVADFNRDNFLDVAIANNNINSVTVKLGNGNGSFGGSVNYPVNLPFALATGDFNQDGNLDLVASDNSSITLRVAVLLGNGAGGFGAATTFPAASNTYAVTVADFNGDNKPDIAAASVSADGTAMSPSVVSVLVNTGNPGTLSFSAPTNFTVGTHPFGIAAGDFNSDGKVDLATANSGSNNVSVLLGMGNGSFQPAVPYATPLGSATGVAISDFNSDGKLDLAVANYTGVGISILMGIGNGTFASAATYATSGGQAYKLAAGDFNNDGKPDLAVAMNNTRRVDLFLNNGLGGFIPSLSYLIGESVLDAGVGDFDHNGKLDVAGTATEVLGVVLNNCVECNYNLASSSQTVSAGGGTVSVNVTTTNGCGWTATSNAGWITISSGASGSGNGTVQLSVAANAGPQRTGTITIAGQAFVVTQQDSSCDVTVNPASLPAGVLGAFYNQTISAAGGTAPHSFTLTAGALPTGVSLSGAGVISGTPTANGTFNFIVTATDANGCLGMRNYTINTCGALTLSPTSLPDAVVGAAYNQTITASGGSAPYAFSITAGALPAGLSLSGGGTLAGTPTAAGTFNFTVIANDANNCFGSLSYNLTVGGAIPYQLLDGFDPNADNVIRTIALQADGKILVGGAFTAIAGQSRNRLARLNSSGSLDTNFSADANADVHILLAQPDGKILVGGNFTIIGGMARSRLARLNADGSVDSAFNVSADAPVHELALQPDGTVIIGGSFTTINGMQRNRLARINADGSLDSSFAPNVDSHVYALVLQSNGKILVGGNFSSVNGTVRNNVARLDSSGLLDAAFNPNTNGVVQDIALQADGKILLGGGFTSVGGVARNIIARLNVDGSLDSAFNANLQDEVKAIAIQTDGRIIVGGIFTPQAGSTPANIARLSTNGTLDLVFTLGANSVVYAVQVQQDGKILMGGAFTNVAGQSRNRIARLYADGNLDLTISPGVDGYVRSLVVQTDGRILVGGQFSSIGGQARNHIARIGTDGVTESAFNPNANAAIQAIALQTDGKILVGGNFTNIDSRTRSRIARLNSDGSVDTGFNPDANFVVYGIAVQATGKILVIGGFNIIDGQTRNRIARLNADGTIDTSFDPNANGNVFTLVEQPDGKIVVGGGFTTMGGQPRNYIARLNSDGSLDTEFNPNANFEVRTLALQSDGKILVGGEFNSIGGQLRNAIARLNSDGSLDTSFDPNIPGYVFSIMVQADEKILVGGGFESVGGQPRNNIARLNINGTADSFNPNTNNNIFAIGLQPDGKVLVGGQFTNIGGQPRDNIARLANTVAALQNLAVNSAGTAITWSRGQASAEVDRINFESSTDGTGWTSLGNGVRVGTSADWQLAGLSLPFNQNLFVRARGFQMTGSLHGGDGSIYESVRLVHLIQPNTAPTIVAQSSVTGIQGTSANLLITAVSDPDAGETLTVKVNGGTSATVNGVTISNITVAAGGNVTADVSATCGATTASFTLTVTDSKNASATGMLTVGVNLNPSPVLGYSNQSGIAGGTLMVTPMTGPSDNGSTASIVIQSVSPPMMVQPTVVGNGVVTIANAGPPGLHVITIRATDNCGTVTDASFTLTVNCPAITLSPATLPGSTVGASYNQTITASGGTAPYSFALMSGTLPNGLSLSAAGVLSGSPNTAGTFNFIIQTTDANNCTGTQSYAVTINSPPSISAVAVTRQQGSPATNSTIANVSDADQAASTLIVTVNGGASATVNGVTVSGLSVNAAGLVSADVVAACAASNASFTLTVTDNALAANSATLNLTVTANSAPALTYSNHSLAAGGSLTVNPTTEPSDNGGISTIVIQSQGTYTGTISVSNATGVVLLSNANPGGEHTITIRVTDSCGATTDAPLTLTVTCPALTLSPATLPDGIAGLSYNQTLTASGGAEPYDFTLTAGALPPGLSLSSTGVLNGVPSATGNFSFTVTANDANGCAGARSYTLTVNPSASTIIVNSLADTAVSADGQCTLREAINNANAAGQTTGGDCITGAPSNTINFSVTGTINLISALPSINSNTTINGPGPGALTVRRNTAGNYGIFSINNGRTVSIAGLTIANGQGGVSNNGMLTITNCAITGNSGSGVNSILGSLVIANSTINGNIASFGGGLSLDSSPATLTNCTLSANTATVFGGGGIYQGGSFGPQILSLTNCTITGNTGGNNGAGIKFNGPAQLRNTLVAANTGLNFVTDGGGLLTSLGHNLDSDGTSGFNNGANGDQVGTSSAPLNARLGLLADNGGPTQTVALLPGSPAINAGTNTDAPATDQRNVSRVGLTDIGAFESRGFTLAITGGSNQSTLVNVAFASPLSVTVSSGFGEPVSGGEVTFTSPGSGASATLSGSPAIINASGQAQVTAIANGAAGGYQVAAAANGGNLVNFSMRNCPVIALNPATLPNGTIGAGYSQTITATGGTPSYGFTLMSGALPGGVSLVAGGALTGTPSVAGTFEFTIKATDANGCTGTKPYSIKINTPPTISALATSRQQGSVASNSTIANVSDAEQAANTLTVTVNGGDIATAGGVTVSGISIGPAGVITASVVAACNATTANFNLTVTDSANASAMATLTVNVTANSAPVLTYANQFMVAAGGSLTIPTATGPEDNGGIASIVLQSQGTYAGMISVNSSTGVISLNGAKPGGSHSITIRVTDNCGAVRDAEFSLTVNCPAITLNPATLPDGQISQPYSQQLSAIGGTAPYIFTVGAGALPNGLTLSPAGLLSGAPTQASTFGFTVSATDADGCPGTQAYSIVVSSCPAIAVNPASLLAGTSFSFYSRQLSADGGALPYNFTINTGALPAGVTLTSEGLLSGVPTVVGVFNFTVRATDVNSCFGERPYTLTITANSGLMFYPLPTPVRLLDTRSGVSGCTTNTEAITAGSTRTQPARTACSTIPANATAVIGNITVVPSGPGFLTLFPSDATQPTVANSNFTAGEVTNNFFTVGLGGDGAFKIFTSATTHVIIDLTGYYAP